MKGKYNNGKIFYGWFIVAAAFIIMATSMGLYFNTASLFIEPVSEELRLSRQEINITFTIRAICSMIISLSSAIIFVKFKIRNLMKLASIILGVSIFCHSFVTSLAMLYFLTVVASVSVMLLSILPLSYILNNWFHERRGFVIGLSFMGSGVGGMIFSSLVGKLIISFGWRVTYRILGVISLIALIPCVFIVIKIRPKDMGLRPFGKPEHTVIEENGKQENREGGILLSTAIKTLGFWSLCLCIMMLSISGNTLMNNISPHLTNRGYSVTFSANIVALCMGSLALGKLALGYLFDKIGVRKTITISCFSIMLGCFSMLYVENYIALIIVIVCVGPGIASFTISTPIITEKIFGARDYNSIFGFLNASNNLGCIIGPMLVGYLYDLYGNYIISFKLMTIVSFIAMIIYQFVLRKKEILTAETTAR